MVTKVACSKMSSGLELRAGARRVNIHYDIESVMFATETATETDTETDVITPHDPLPYILYLPIPPPYLPYLLVPSPYVSLLRRPTCSVAPCRNSSCTSVILGSGLVSELKSWDLRRRSLANIPRSKTC